MCAHARRLSSTTWSTFQSTACPSPLAPESTRSMLRAQPPLSTANTRRPAFSYIRRVHTSSYMVSPRTLCHPGEGAPSGSPRLGVKRLFRSHGRSTVPLTILGSDS
eukprot:4372721-Prymnesium_polylepis.1